MKAIVHTLTTLSVKLVCLRARADSHDPARGPKHGLADKEFYDVFVQPPPRELLRGGQVKPSASLVQTLGVTYVTNV